MNREQLLNRFETIFNHLNSEQQEAVNTIYGPVLVIAGPGTGKTQILSARIGNILLKTDYLPENILCLTYTDAGRVAMRRRLQDMIGADAYRVNIHTFHSFCHQLIQENVQLFHKNVLDPVSDLERIDFLKQIIDGFKKDNPLKRYRGDAYYDVKRIGNLISTMKREGWSAEFLINKIEAYISALPNRSEYQYKVNRGVNKVGDLRVALFEEEVNKMKSLQAGIDAYQEFQNLMHKHNRYDFDDMINWVKDAMEKNDHFRLDLQEKYQMLLVDEFQDTSGTQNALLQLLCKDVEQPNLFVVGDDDQSIFRFQGANIENITGFSKLFDQELKKIVLRKNYRSTQIILDASKVLIENNEERLSNSDHTIVKNLDAANEARKSISAKPVLQQYENTFQEMAGTTEAVFQLIQQGIAPNKIAILYKENKWGNDLLKYFKQKNIPYYSRLKENLFHIPLSKKIITILRYIAFEVHLPYSGDELLFEILHFDLYNIPPYEIAKASVRVNDKKGGEKTSLRIYFQEWINTKNRTLFDIRPHEGLVQISSLLEKWIHDHYNGTIIDLVENIMQEGGFLHDAMKDTNEKQWKLEVLRSFMSFVKNEMQRNPDNTLVDLLSVIDLMEEQDIIIPLYRVYGNELGVTISTVHGSKGLEWEYVFLLNTTTATWEPKKGGSQNFSMPDNLYYSVGDTNENNLMEEQRRIFFVALTRAEEHIFISWSKQDDQQKILEPCRFIKEITDHVELPLLQVRLSESTIQEYLTLHLLKNKQPVLDSTESDMINEALAKFELSSTALNNYLNCPLRFYYNNLIRVPSGKNEHTAFGSAVHFALEKLFNKMKENNKTFPELTVFIDDFTWYLHKHRESFTKEAYNRRKEYGIIVLTELYQQHINTWNKYVSIERPFNSVMVDGVPLKGVVDKIEYTGKTGIDGSIVTLVDYKTGEYKKEKVAPPSESNKIGSDYWRQGVFYKLMLDNCKLKDFNVTKTTFQFVEPDKKKNQYIQVDIIPTPEDLALVRQQITDTWKKIQNHDFYTGCGKENCHWCNFVKDTKQYVDLKELVDDEE